MAVNKKNASAAAQADTPPVAESASVAPDAVPAAAPVAKPAARKRAPAKPRKALDPVVQASQEALAKALAAAQAVKVGKPVDKPAKAEKEDKPAKAEKAERIEKAPKARKAKLVRDSFTMPEGEYAQIAALKKRLLERGQVAKKSELLRAGIALLAGLADAELTAAVQKVEVIKTGRPAKAGK